MLKINFKRMLCLCLALIMLGSFNCVAFADVETAEPELTVTTEFYRFDDTANAWVETDKVIAGEDVKARVFVDTSYYAGSPTFLFFYNKDMFEDSYAKDTIINFALNKESGSYADTYNVQANLVLHSNGSRLVNNLVSNGMITSDFAQSHQCVMLSIILSELNCCKFNGDKYLFEYDLIAKENAQPCEGDFFIVPETISTPENPRGVVDVPVGNADTPIGNAVAFFNQEISIVLDSDPVRNYSTVTVDANGGAFANGEETYTEKVLVGSEFDISAIEEPVREGHQFSGWVDEDGNSAEQNITAGFDDITVVADWEALGYSVIYYSDENTVFASHGGLYGTKVPEFTDVPEKEGYEFVGWDKEIPETFPAYNYKVYAVWEAKDYTVTWIIDGVETSETVEYGETITAPDVPEKEGHDFLGWGKEIPATMPAENLTFTAEWEARGYSVIYYSDENTVFASHGGTYGVEVPELNDIPEKEGYEFIGWDKEIPETFPAYNYRVYAVWKAKNYTVTWIIEGAETVTTVACGEAITKPSVSAKDGYAFIGWDTEVPATMPAGNLTFTAVFDTYYLCPDCGEEFFGDEIEEHIAYENQKVPVVTINRNPGSTSLSYGDSIKLTATVADAPEGAKIYWYVDGNKKGEGESFTYTPEGNVEITVKLVDINGNPLKDADGNEISDSENVNVKNGFFQKLIAFFKKLFGLTKTIIQAYSRV